MAGLRPRATVPAAVARWKLCPMNQLLPRSRETVPPRSFSLHVLLAALVCVMLAAVPAHAQARDTLPTALDTLRVNARIDNLIGVAATASEGVVGARDLAARPLLREGEILETVPGVIVTQHSGDGKANQYFVRGFNLDHGTDFQTRVEGMPVNMPSHGHGQGYTDLNFLIPEFVDYLDYRLGVAHAEVGDFGSAGAAHIHLVRSLPRPFVVAEGGQNGFARVAGGASGALGGGTLLVGGEGRVYDGPWEVPEELRKGAAIGRWTRERGASRLSILALAYRNRWNASDQIPLRDGSIGRFSQIDSTDGGDARRYSLSVDWRHATPGVVREARVFGIASALNLYSNFGYFLDDAERGDQFHQHDRRFVTGAELRQTQGVTLLGRSHALMVGAQLRGDFIGGLGLHRTVARVRHATVRDDEVTEAAAGLFAEARTQWSPRLRTVLGMRADGFSFDVRSDRAANSGTERAGIVSPKASLVFTPSPVAELYLSGGLGFHSNDARGTVISVDPASGGAAERVDPLVRSRGAEVGVRAAPASGVRSTLTLWALELDSELLFVGDAGATEPTATSHRQGVTWANFWRPLPSLSVDADVSFSRARLAGVAAGEDRIPGALENVVAGGVAWIPARGFSAALRLRHFGAYPLIEDNSVRADAATLLNGEAGYRFRRGVRVEAALLNLLNSDARDIQYFYASRLPGEPAEGVEDIHFHPVEPRQLRVTLRWEF